MSAEPIELLICDCDGVIVDSEIVSERLMQHALSVYAPAEEVAGLLSNAFGLTSLDIVKLAEQRFGVSIPASLTIEVRRRSEALLASETPIITGVREALEAIELPLAVASNSRLHCVETVLRRAGLSERVGGHVSCAEMVALPKPAPDVYLHAAASRHTEPARCLAIEDSTTGVRAALAAGMRVIGFIGASHIPLGHADTLHRLGVTAIIERMEQLPAMVAALRREAGR